MRLGTLIGVLAIAAITGYSQEPDRWRGLIIDESTVEQAKETLGEPRSDKTGNRYLLGKWFKSGAGKALRMIHYKDLEGFSDVKLGFSEDGILRLIHLEPRKISAQAFIASYDDMEFRFANEVMSPADFKNSRDNLEKPQRLASWYELVSVNDKVIMKAGVGNATGNVMSTMLGGSAARQSGRTVPGNVKLIQIISRTLENRDGSDLLK